MYMSKKISIILALAAVFALAFGALPSSAADNGADIKLYCENQNVALGKSVKIAVSVENIVAPGGIIGCDIPVFYDNKMLKLTKIEPFYPDCWDGFGIYMGLDASESDGSPYYIRALCDANDLGQNTGYGVKENKKLYFVLTFDANKEGTTEISVKNSPSTSEYIYVVGCDEMKNYGAEGDSITVTIGGEAVSSEISEESSTGEDSSLEESSADSADESSGLSDASSDDVLSSTEETSELVSDAESEDATSENTEQTSNEASTEDESAEENKGDEKGTHAWIYIVIAVVAVLAVGGATAAILLSKRAAKKTEAELDGDE